MIDWKKFEKPEIFDRLEYEPFRLDCEFLGNATITRLGVCFKDLIPIANSTYSYPYARIKNVSAAYASLARRGVEHIPAGNGEIGVIHAAWTGGYYHWITESIPRLLTLKSRYPKSRVLLPDYRNYRNFSKFISLLGHDEPEFFPNNKNISSERIVLATCPSKMAILDGSAYREVRDLFLSRIDPPRNPDRKIYISRRMARGRYVTNEDEVFGLLKKHGYEEVSFDNMSIVDQIEICSSSSSMISIHGAGLTNMIFMQPGGNILELMPRKRGFFREYNPVRQSAKHDPCFYRLALNLDHRYSFLECEPVSRGKRTSHMDDIRVDLNELNNLLETNGQS